MCDMCDVIYGTPIVEDLWDRERYHPLPDTNMKNPFAEPFDDGHLTIPQWDWVIRLARLYVVSSGYEGDRQADSALLTRAQARLDRINEEVLKPSHPDARKADASS